MRQLFILCYQSMEQITGFNKNEYPFKYVQVCDKTLLKRIEDCKILLLTSLLLIPLSLLLLILSLLSIIFMFLS